MSSVSTSGPGRFDHMRLGPLEQQVMDVLWDAGPASIRDIIARLDADLAYTTIATVLGNLHRKDLVAAEKQDRSVRYCATRTREMHAARLMEQALSGSGDRAASILHFIETIDARDLQLLRDYLYTRENRT